MWRESLITATIGWWKIPRIFGEYARGCSMDLPERPWWLNSPTGIVDSSDSRQTRKNYRRFFPRRNRSLARQQRSPNDVHGSKNWGSLRIFRRLILETKAS